MKQLAIACRARLSPVFALDVAIDLPPGIIIVFGRSGSGKSTLLRCVSGLTRPDSGTIRVGDRTLFDAAAGIDIPVAERRVGYVFQQLALFPHMTVGDNLAYGLVDYPRSERSARIDRIARSFRIAHLLDRRPGTISGGERQRTALARSLVTDPDVLLLDEPLSALDHATQSQIMNDLRQWNAARQIPVLYVTHAHREALALGERALVLDDGRLVAAGTPQHILDSPGSELLAEFSGFENLFDATVVAVAREAGTMACRIGGGLEIEAPYVSGAAAGQPIRLAIRAGDILVATAPPVALSARNVIPGVVRGVNRHGTTVAVRIDAGAGFDVHITPHALDALALREGSHAWLVIKTHSCHPIAAPPT
jgi:molybdate transport system ATP-binding protein